MRAIVLRGRGTARVVCSRRTASAALGGLCLIALFLSACVWLFERVDVKSVNPPVTVRSPVKAHLKDGSTVVFPNGVVVEGTRLRGTGQKYDLTLAHSDLVEEIPLDSVAAMESFRTVTDVGASTATSVLASVGGFFGGALLLKAIFGSCPTVYSVEDGAPRLEAETFSYSVIPLFEARDLDRLSIQPDSAGQVRLEIRNEALETHYINHLQLVEVRHAPDDVGIPDQTGQPVVVGDFHSPARAKSRSGHDLMAALAQADGIAASTDASTLAAAGIKDLDDWIDLDIPGLPPTDRVAIVLRARSSLLNTVLFYDVMLAGAGARALDEMASDADTISKAVEMGRWARRRMGLRVAVWRGGRYEEVARIPDPGPIAWHDVAAVIPWSGDESDLRVRLSLVADAWRLDHVAVASRVRNAEARSIPLTAVTGSGGAVEDSAFASLREADGRYLQTSPGQRFQARFDVGAAKTGGGRTFFLSSQGYYTEWIRAAWLRGAPSPRPFTLSDEALADALARWKATRTSFEQEFERQRIPVN